MSVFVQITTFILLFASAPAHAWLKCPVGREVLFNESGVVQFVGDGGKLCVVSNPQILRKTPLKVMGCSGANVQSPTVRLPTGLKHNCPEFSKPIITLASRNFELQPDIVAQTNKALSDLTQGKPVQSVEPPQVVANEGASLGLMVENLRYEGKGIKKFDEVDTYAKCLLDTKYDKSNFDEYSNQYASNISYASENFGVPSFALKCTCAKETRFTSSAGERKERGWTSTAGGVCQATGDFLKDLNNELNGCLKNAAGKWICTPSAATKALRAKWDEYLAASKPRDNSAASKKCFAALKSSKPYRLTKELLEACPHVSLGTASMGMNLIVQRQKNALPKDEQRKIDEILETNPLDGWAAVAGAYNVGSIKGLLERVGKKQNWQANLTAKACETDSAKLIEVRAHVVKIRNCMQEDAYLDHADNSLDDECVGRAVTPARRAAAENAAHKFSASFPRTCAGDNEMATTPRSAGGVDGDNGI